MAPEAEDEIGTACVADHHLREVGKMYDAAIATLRSEVDHQMQRYAQAKRCLDSEWTKRIALEEELERVKYDRDQLRDKVNGEISQAVDAALEFTAQQVEFSGTECARSAASTIRGLKVTK
jgi:hypothetical protein